MELPAFILISIGIIVVPGPNVLVIIATTLGHGYRRGLQTVAGTSSAMALQLLVAALLTGGVVNLLADGFTLLKWLGVIYLFYLGLNELFAALNKANSKKGPNELSARGSFKRGFWISLSNPKTIAFFSAFLPQFARADASYFIKITQLSVLFWCLAVFLDASYALLANKLGGYVLRRVDNKMQHSVSSAVYLGAATALANSRPS